MERIQEEVLQPLWDAQNDIWSPGGEANEAQEQFELRYREIEILQKAIELDQRDLDARWQVLWSSTGVDPEYQVLEDLRYEKQRELDRLYRFGNRPVDDLWDEINELNASQGWANTDSQIESELLNQQLRALYDLQNELQNGNSDLANELYNKASGIQDQLNHLYNFGWDPINEIYAEIDRLESERTNDNSVGDTRAISLEIINLQNQKASYVTSRDAEIAVLNAELEALEVTTTESTTDATAGDSSARIDELNQFIADLEDEAAGVVEDKNAEIDDLSTQIDEKKASYNQLIEDAQTAFQILSDSLYVDIDALAAQIAELEEIGGDDANAEIAILQPSYDAMIAAEQAEEDDLHVLLEKYETERDAGVDELQELKDAAEALLLSGLTETIDAQIAVYNFELEALQTETNDDTTDADVVVTTSIVDEEAADAIRASIEAVENNWNLQIAPLNNQIQILQNQLGSASANDLTDDRINSLRLQISEMEEALNVEITSLEALINELYRQADDAQSGNSGQWEEIQSQINDLNRQLEAIWQRDSAQGLQILLQVQALEKQVRILQEELEQQQYRLEEELWDLDDQLSLFYKDQSSGQQVKEAAFQAEANELQIRRAALDELRWAIDDEQRIVFDEIEARQAEAHEAVRLIESEQMGTLKDQMRAVEIEIRTFRDMQNDLEGQLRDAQSLVEDKKRELEDKVFDALESAAGTVDQAGDTVLTATEESGSDVTEEELFEEQPVADPTSTPEVTEVPEEEVAAEATAVTATN